LNGEYWGVYEIREKVDDSDFTDYYYDQDVPDIQFLKTWGGTWSEYGGAQAQTDWDDLKNYIVGNDMTVEANFDYVSSKYNWKSLIDYMVLNSYVVCSDWLNWNTAWWRGLNPDGDKKKWRYVLWDMDATFGHYINYTGIPDQGASADPCDPEDLGDTGGQGHVPILNSLMENPTFRQYYVSRYIDLSNSVFSCEFMIGHLDELISDIEPEMQRQIDKWGGTYAEWQSNVQDLRDFINTRCVDLSDGMIDCYDVEGPYDLSFNVYPPQTGRVKVNSLWLEDYPFSGVYYGNIDILLKASAEPGWVFDHWQLDNHSVYPSNSLEDVSLLITTADNVVAHFVPILSVDLGNDTLLCEGASVLLDAGTPGSTYEWQDGSTEQTFLATEPGTYSVTLTNAEGTFSVSDQIVVSVSSISAGNDQTICSGNIIGLTGSGGDNYTWTPSTYLSDPNIANPVATPLDTITYYLTVEDASGCLYYDSVNITVLPPLDMSATANVYNVCPDGEVIITVEFSGGGGAPYTLFDESFEEISSPFSVFPLESKEIVIHGTDACQSRNSTSVFINTHPAPEIDVYANITAGCSPLTVRFIEKNGNDGYSYNWSFIGDTTGFSTSPSPANVFYKAGTYDVALKMSNEYGCESERIYSEMIEVYPDPKASFYPVNDTISFFDPVVQFTNTSDLLYSCVWDFGDGYTSTTVNPEHTFGEVREYFVRLDVESNRGCKDATSSKIIVDDQVVVYAPNAIVPNSNNKNSKFYLIGHGITDKNFYMAIYNRWGALVYETREYDSNNPEASAWDGTSIWGNDVSGSVYTWVATFVDNKGGVHKLSGTITVLR
jgi:PKD repeat protein